MVDIVTPGRDLDAVTEATCGFCEAVLGFKPSEATRVPDERDGDYYYIVCPSCGHDVTKSVALIDRKS